ncbi:MAG: hypothetical protein ACOCQD_04740 [archaeon]
MIKKEKVLEIKIRINTIINLSNDIELIIRKNILLNSEDLSDAQITIESSEILNNYPGTYELYELLSNLDNINGLTSEYLNDLNWYIDTIKRAVEYNIEEGVRYDKIFGDTKNYLKKLRDEIEILKIELNEIRSE